MDEYIAKAESMYVTTIVSGEPNRFYLLNGYRPSILVEVVSWNGESTATRGDRLHIENGGKVAVVRSVAELEGLINDDIIQNIK